MPMMAIPIFPLFKLEFLVSPPLLVSLRHIYIKLSIYSISIYTGYPYLLNDNEVSLKKLVDVAKALEFYGNTKASETKEFVETFDC